MLAPNSPYRQDITLKPQIKQGFQFHDDKDLTKKPANHSWSKMLAKVFKIDVTQCEDCGGKMRAVCAILDSDSIRRYLKHISVDYEPPARAPPKNRMEARFIDQSVYISEEDSEDLTS